MWFGSPAAAISLRNAANSSLVTSRFRQRRPPPEYPATHPTGQDRRLAGALRAGSALGGGGEREYSSLPAAQSRARSHAGPGTASRPADRARAAAALTSPASAALRKAVRSSLPAAVANVSSPAAVTPCGAVRLGAS